MTTLVTGATGFIGGNLARTLWTRGEDVRALVRPSANDLAIRETGVAQVTGDLLDSESVQRAVDGCETVYHCAATYAFWSPRPREVYRSNVAGTENLLDAARRAGVRRVVFTSSVSTIGIPDQGSDDSERLGTEEMPPRPALLIGYYKQSKYASEQVALAANDGEMEVVVVNPCAPVGEWDVKPTPTGQIPLSFARGKAPGYIATGMNLVDVADVAEGHILAMERGVPGERYILGYPQSHAEGDFRHPVQNHRTARAQHSHPALGHFRDRLPRRIHRRHPSATPAGGSGRGHQSCPAPDVREQQQSGVGAGFAPEPG